LRTIDSEADIAAGLAALVAADPRLAGIQARAGPVPLRRRAGGFEGLAAIVTGQQISSTAAAAIWGRLTQAVLPFTPEALLGASEPTLKVAGLSRAKIRTLTGLAVAVSGGLDLDRLGQVPAQDAVAALATLDGIGPWTAECYLLFCLGHPDVFPAGDLALQVAVQHGLGLERRPSDKALRAIAAEWSPWRAVAARLFWAYYRTLRVPAGV
jgi:DNA-3-methyladenine glycosylase II